MQVIYIDSLLCVNLFIDYIMLYSIRKFLHINSGNLRLLLGSTFAAVSTLGVFLPFYTIIFSIFYRLITAFITVLISFGFSDIKKAFIRSFAFILMSMVLCGVVIVIELTMDSKRICIYNDTVYFDISPVMLILITSGTYIALSVYDKLRNTNNMKTKILNITFYTSESTCVSFESMVDTGCTLKEPFSGLPVILAEEELLKTIYVPQEKMRIIPFSTASGLGSVYGFKPLRLTVNGQTLHSGCYIGICKNTLKGEIKSITGTEIAEAI